MAAIQIPQGPISSPATGEIQLEWFLLIQQLIAASGISGNTTVNDIATQQAFESDSTSLVAELKKEIDVIDVDKGNPFEVTGTVRYVNASSPNGVLSVGGVPYQNNGTITHAWAGTSGGVPYFNSATSMLSSAALSQYSVVVGGGAGAAPATVTAGTNNQFLAGNTGANPGMRAIRMDDVPPVLGFAARHG